MINITAEKQELLVKIEMSIGYYVMLRFRRDCEMDATLLANQIIKDLNNRIEEIRRDAYNLGWSDKASRKHSKRQHFSGYIRKPEVGREFIGY